MGSQLTFQRVPRLSFQPKISLPKPTEKTSTFTPKARATRKWPSSWKNTTRVMTNRKAGSPIGVQAISPRTISIILRPYPLADFLGQYPCPGIGAQYAFQIPGRAVGAVIAVQRLRHHPGDVQEPDTAFQEGLHGNFIGSVKDRGGQPPGPHRADGQIQSRKTVMGGSLKDQAAQRRQVQPAGRRWDSARPTQGMGDGGAHIGRR